MTMFDEQGDKLKGLIDNMVDSLQLKFVNTTIVCSWQKEDWCHSSYFIHYYAPLDYLY